MIFFFFKVKIKFFFFFEYLKGIKKWCLPWTDIDDSPCIVGQLHGLLRVFINILIMREDVFQNLLFPLAMNFNSKK
jgi:hypothetical protein